MLSRLGISRVRQVMSLARSRMTTTKPNGYAVVVRRDKWLLVFCIIETEVRYLPPIDFLRVFQKHCVGHEISLVIYS